MFVVLVFHGDIQSKRVNVESKMKCFNIDSDRPTAILWFCVTTHVHAHMCVCVCVDANIHTRATPRANSVMCGVETRQNRRICRL